MKNLNDFGDVKSISNESSSGSLKIIPLAAEKSSRFKFKFSNFRIRWQVLIPLGVLHLGAVVALFNFQLDAFLTFLALWLLTGMLGITVGYHRMLSHQAFETYPWVRGLHLFFAALTMQQGPIAWARIHRAHHQFSDTIRDPHPQLFGIFFGHLGWSFLAHREIGRSDIVRRIPDDLINDPIVRFFETFWYPIFLASFLALYLVGGWPMLLWAGFFRTAFVLHITWSVNSLTHRWGYRNFETRDKSVNNWLVGILAWGEGWHNNHHQFPYSARHGIKWWEIDLSWLWIQLLKYFGLAWRVKTPRHNQHNIL